MGQRCLVVALDFYEWVRHEVASVIVRRTPFGRTCRPIGSTLGGMGAWQRVVLKPADNGATVFGRICDENEHSSCPAAHRPRAMKHLAFIAPMRPPSG
jgi:hypothetical protein